MAAGKVSRIIHAPGRVVVGPSNLSSAFPHGGTEVGKTNAFGWSSHGVPFRVECEGLGEATDILEPNQRFSVSFFVRGWDDDAVELLLATGFVAGGTSQHAVFKAPVNVPGGTALGRAVILLYVPDDTIHVPAVLVYRGIPEWTEGSEIAFRRGDELGIPITVDCLRDANLNTLAIGRFDDLSLT